jgi:hypothetical protein
MSASKKIESKSVHPTKSHATVEASEEAPPSPTTAPTTPAEPSTTSASLNTAAKTALALISQAQKVLPLTPGLGDKARQSAVKMQVLPSDLMTEAANFLATNAESYPVFDGEAIQGAAQLEQSLNQVVTAASTLISRAQSTVLEQRGPAMEQSLALYATLKARSRTDSSVRDTVAKMEPLVNTRKTPHQRRQQRIKAKTKKVAALSASLAKDVASSSAPPEPVAATPAPVATPPAAPAATAALGSNGASAPPAASH